MRCPIDPPARLLWTASSCGTIRHILAIVRARAVREGASHVFSHPIKSHGEQLGNGGRESSRENEDTATGRLEVTCIECKASLLVTTHAKLQPGKRVTNQFTIKKSMHKRTCSLYMEPAKTAAMVKLPSKGKKITISNVASSCAVGSSSV